MDNGDEEKGLDEIDDVEANGRVLETEETHHSLPSVKPPRINTRLPEPGPQGPIPTCVSPRWMRLKHWEI